MKEIKLPSGNYLFVEVPNNAKDFEILNKGFNRGSALLNICWNNEEKCVPYIDKKHPFKLYNEEIFQIISTTNDITEEQCSSIVLCVDIESHKLFGDGKFKNYNSQFPYYYNTSEESLQSLIQANNLDIENNYLILKEIKF